MHIEKLLPHYLITQKSDPICWQGLHLLQAAGLIPEDCSNDRLAKSFIEARSKEALVAWFGVLESSELFHPQYRALTESLISHANHVEILLDCINLLISAEIFSIGIHRDEKARFISRVLEIGSEDFKACLMSLHSVRLLTREILEALVDLTTHLMSIKIIRVMIPLMALTSRFVELAECVRNMLQYLKSYGTQESLRSIIDLLRKKDMLTDELMQSIVDEMPQLCQEGEPREASLSALRHRYHHLPALLQTITNELYLNDGSIDAVRMHLMVEFVGDQWMTIDQFQDDWDVRFIYAEDGSIWSTYRKLLDQIDALSKQGKQSLMQFLVKYPEQRGQVSDFLCCLETARLISRSAKVMPIIESFVTQEGSLRRGVLSCLLLLSWKRFFEQDTATRLIMLIMKYAHHADMVYQILQVAHEAKIMHVRSSSMHIHNFERLVQYASADLLDLMKQIVAVDNVTENSHRNLRFSFLIGNAKHATAMAKAHKMLAAIQVCADDLICMLGKDAVPYAKAYELLKMNGLTQHELLMGQIFINAKNAVSLARVIVFLQMHGVPYTAMGAHEDALFSAASQADELFAVLSLLDRIMEPVTLQRLEVLLSDSDNIAAFVDVLTRLMKANLLLSDTREANIKTIFEHYALANELCEFLDSQHNAPFSQAEFNNMIKLVKARKTAEKKFDAELVKTRQEDSSDNKVNHYRDQFSRFFARNYKKPLQEQKNTEKYNTTKTRSL